MKSSENIGSGKGNRMDTVRPSTLFLKVIRTPSGGVELQGALERHPTASSGFAGADRLGLSHGQDLFAIFRHQKIILINLLLSTKIN